jgi:hypothetical protein
MDSLSTKDCPAFLYQSRRTKERFNRGSADCGIAMVAELTDATAQALCIDPINQQTRAAGSGEAVWARSIRQLRAAIAGQ